MSYVSSYLDEILNVQRGTALSAWTPYVALFDGDPESGGTELTNSITGSNNRSEVSYGAPQSDGGNGRQIVNSSEIEITASAQNVGDVNVDYFAIYDAQTSGNLRAKMSTGPHTVSAGNRVVILPTDLQDILT